MRIEWLLCPICKSKTRLQLREDTELKNFPLYCPKCKQETLINAKDLQITVIQKREHESNYVSRRMGNTIAAVFVPYGCLCQRISFCVAAVCPAPATA